MPAKQLRHSRFHGNDGKIVLCVTITYLTKHCRKNSAKPKRAKLRQSQFFKVVDLALLAQQYSKSTPMLIGRVHQPAPSNGECCSYQPPRPIRDKFTKFRTIKITPPAIKGVKHRRLTGNITTPFFRLFFTACRHAFVDCFAAARP
jgi:hypothetical protein